MELITLDPRPDLEHRLEGRGMTWFTGPKEPTWCEHKAYVFTADEVARLETGANEILDMIPAAVERMIGDRRMLDRLGIPDDMRPYLTETWDRQDPDFYGRMDFGWDFASDPKLYEYNADTSACLWEGCVVEPEWWGEKGLLQFPAGAAMWNDLFAELTRAFREVPLPGGSILFTSPRGNDERMKGALAMAKAAKDADYTAHFAFLEDLAVNGDYACDLSGNRARVLFKVYWAWEKLMRLPLGKALAASSVVCIEPFWKVLLQNKLFPAVLWDLHPGHPNLLETYAEDDPRAARLGNSGFARKTVFGREGSNVELMMTDGRAETTDGPYEATGWVRQKLHPLPEVDGRHPMMGVWAVRGRACGLIIRESAGLITRNESPVVPNVVLPAA
jgi:glutathionylspermidine synthase